MRLVIRTRKMRKNIYGKKKYLEEGMRGKTNWTFVAKHLLHLFYLSVQFCTFCRDVFVRGKWSDDNEYVVMLRVRRRRVVISYIICNWSQSIVSISPWSPPSPTPPHLGMEECTLYVQRYYLLLIYYLARDTDSSAWLSQALHPPSYSFKQSVCSVLLKVDD